MTESDCEHQERNAPCECDVWADLGRRLLVEKLQTTADEPFDAMAAAAQAIRQDELDAEDLRECQRALARAGAVVDLLDEVVEGGGENERLAE